MQDASPFVLIGLHSERPRSGKSTVAAAIAEVHGGKVYSIADGIRDMARTLGFAAAADATGDDKDVPLPSLGGLTPRQVLILIGESRCAKHGMDYWIIRTLNRIAEDGAAVAIIDDVRRRVEGDVLLESGGTICTVTREGVYDVRDINTWSADPRYTFANDATPADCAARIWARAERDRKTS